MSNFERRIVFSFQNYSFNDFELDQCFFFVLEFTNLYFSSSKSTSAKKTEFFEFAVVFEFSRQALMANYYDSFTFTGEPYICFLKEYLI